MAQVTKGVQWRSYASFFGLKNTSKKFKNTVLFTIASILSLTSVHAQSGQWDAIATVGGTGNVDHTNGVIQLLDNTQTGCSATAVHETSDTYDPTTDGVFSKCYNVYFGCPGNDNIGSDSKGDGMAFSFHKCGTGVGGCGGGLGYANLCNQMITLEFDTYSSAGTGNFDANFGGGTTGTNDEIALHRDGMADDPGRITAVDAGNLEDGLEHQVCISYDPTSGVLNVDIDGVSTFNYTMATADRLENYFGAGGLTQTWSSGKFGAVNPATVSDANQNDLTDNIGAPLCPASSVINSHQNGDNIAVCSGPVQLSSFAVAPAGNTVDRVEFFVNGGLQGTATVDPTNSEQYLFDWTPPSNGSYLLRANAYFTPSGTQINSYDVQVNVTSGTPPTVTASSNDADNTLCYGESITLTGTGNAATYSWDNGVSDGVSFTPSSTTTYTLTGTDADGCSATDQVTVTVNAIPTVTAGGGGAICDGESVNITASGATNYTWDNGAGTGNSVSVSPTTTTTYTVNGESNNCTNTDQVTVTVNAIPTVTASGGGAICEGESVNITASGATNYTWDNGAGTGNSVSVSPTTTTIYTVTGESNNCTNTDQVTVTVNAIPTITAGGGGAICEGESINITASGATNYTWDNGAGTGNSVSVSPTTTTTYTVTGESNNCTNTDQVTLTVNAIPTITAGGGGPICEGESVNITASGATNYTWDNGAGTGNSVSVSPTTTTTYTVTGEANNCTDTDQVTVTVNTIPTVTAGGGGAICDGESINITASGATNYTWDNGVGTGNSVSVSPTTTTTYTVTGEANNCTNTDQVTVTVNAIPSVSAGGGGTICDGESVTITASGATNYTWDNGAGSGNSVSVSPTTTTTYTVTGESNNCTNTDQVTVTVNAIPTVSVSGGGSICDDNASTSSLDLVFTGTGPFDFEILKNSALDSSLTGQTANTSIALIENGTYQVGNYSDQNCNGAANTQSITIDYHDNVLASATVECNDINNALAIDEFQIRVTVSSGDLASINISEITSNGVIFDDLGGGVWLSRAINETNSVDINVTDGNNCNGGFDIAGLQQQCSCPASGLLSFIDSDSICPYDSSLATITMSTTIGTGPFNVNINSVSSGTQTFSNTGNSVQFYLKAEDVYTATIEDIGNNCTVSADNSLQLHYHQIPEGILSGDDTICNANETATAQIIFSGMPQYQFNINNGGDSESLSSNNDVMTLGLDESGTYTLSDLSDRNCLNGLVSGSALVNYYDDVLATATTECSDMNASLASNEYQIRVEVQSGDLNSIAISELSSNGGITFSEVSPGIWLSDNGINESLTVDINVTDKNNCHGGLNILGLQRQCTCPTTGTIAFENNNDNICPDDTTIVQVTFSGGAGPYDVTMYLPNGSEETITNVSSIFDYDATESGNYQARIYNNGDACDYFTQTINLTHQQKLVPTISIFSNELTICEGESINLTATATNAGSIPEYVWFVDGQEASTTNNTSFTTSALSSNTTLTAQLKSSETCILDTLVDANSINIDVVQKPTPSLIQPSAICENQQTVLLANFDANSTVEWHKNGSIIPVTGNSVSISSLNDAGSWYITENNGVCPTETSSDVQVQVDQLPAYSFEPIDPISLDESVQIEIIQSTGSIDWTQTEVLDNSTVNNPIFSPVTGGYNILDFTMTNGLCSATGSVTILVKEPIKIPNVFTPNNDGEYDVWKIYGLDSYAAPRVTVYNRWGNVVLKTSGKDFKWDGTINGNELPVATYYYIVEADEDEIYNGTVTIVR